MTNFQGGRGGLKETLQMHQLSVHSCLLLASTYHGSYCIVWHSLSSPTIACQVLVCSYTASCWETLFADSSHHLTDKRVEKYVNIDVQPRNSKIKFTKQFSWDKFANILPMKFPIVWYIYGILYHTLEISQKNFHYFTKHNFWQF